MKSTAQLSSDARASVPVSEHLPLGSHVAPNVVKLTQNGEYAATWRVDGVAFATTENLILNQRFAEEVNAIGVLGGGQIALWSHMVRRQIKDRLPGTFENVYCEGLDERYSQTFNDYKLMLTELYLTVIYRPQRAKRSLFFGMGKRSYEQVYEQQLEALAALEDAAKQVEASLAGFGLKRLSVLEKNGQEYSEMASFYGFLINGFWEDVPYAQARLKEYLPVATLYFGDNNGLAQSTLGDQTKFHAFVELKEYPAATKPGLLNALLSTQYEWVQTHSFSPKAKRDAVDWLQQQRGRMIAGDEASSSEINEIDEAIDDVQSGRIEMGEYHFALNVIGSDLDETVKNAADAIGLIGAAGGRAVYSRQVPELSWLSQVPGTWNKRPRKAVISSANYAGLVPFHNHASGRRDRNPWGPAVTLLRTESGQPFYFNFHSVSPGDGDKFDQKLNGNTFVAGSSGAGKTTSVGFLLAQAQKFSPKVVAFDRGQNMEILIRVMGGKYYNLKSGIPTGFNPFQWADTVANRRFCMDVVARCAHSESTPLSPQQKDAIAKAVNTVFDLDYSSRRIAMVPQNLTDPDLHARLARWVDHGDLAWVLDNPQNTLDLGEHRIIGYDYTDFLDDPETRPVVMMVLLAATDRAMDGTPTMLVMDEFWKPLLDPVFSGFARETLKTIRHRSGLGIFVTQSPSDVLQHSIARTVVEQCVTQIFLPNMRGTAEEYIDGLKLNTKEFELVKSFAETSRKMLVKQGDRSTVVTLNLGSMQDDIIFLSGSKDNVTLLHQLLPEYGDDPADWGPVLMEQVQARRSRNGIS